MMEEKEKKTHFTNRFTMCDDIIVVAYRAAMRHVYCICMHEITRIAANSVLMRFSTFSVSIYIIYKYPFEIHIRISVNKVVAIFEIESNERDKTNTAAV